MKKTKIVTFLVLIASIYCNCYGKEKMNFLTRDQKNIRTGENIIKCISEKNAEKLKGLFCPEVIKSESHLDEDINSLFNFCDGIVTEYKKICMGEETSIEKQNNSTSYCTTYNFVISGITYILYYVYCPKNSFDVNQEGLKAIRIVKKEEDKKYFFYWNEIKPGITICNY